MSTPRLALVFAAAIVCASLPRGVSAQSESRTSFTQPRDIALHPADMPSGYVRYLARTTTNSAIAKENGVPVSVYTKIGRVVGYETGYKVRPGPMSSRAMCCVDVEVVKYRSPDGAAQAFALGRQMVKNTYGHDRGFRALLDATGGTGVQTFPCHCGASAPQTVYIVTTHLRNFLVSTEVHFPPGTAQRVISEAAARLQTIMVNR